MRAVISVPQLVCILFLAAQGSAQTTGPADRSGDVYEQWTNAQRWAIACSAILTETNHRSHRLLGEVEKTPANEEKIRQELSRGLWRVNNREDLLERLDWIDRAGQRKDFEDFSGRVEKMSDAEFAAAVATTVDERRSPYHLRYAREHYKEAGREGLLGFDYIRYITLCRSGYVAGYLTAGEAWQRIMPVARLLKKTYKSWDALSQNYLLGRNFWLEEGQENFKRAVDRLLHEKTSPWVELSWDTDLGEGEVHEPVYRPVRSDEN